MLCLISLAISIISWKYFPMIRLKDETPFAHGNHREVYRHPEKPLSCLKLMKEDWRECDRWKRANILSKIFRPRRYYHENEGELHFSTELAERVGSAAWDFVAQAHGQVETDLGTALEVDLVLDHDQKISLSLKEYVWRNGYTIECENALDDFWTLLNQNWVFVEARPDNLSVRQDLDGGCQIFAIDGYAYGQFIPLSKWFKKERIRVLQKRRRKQRAVIDEILKQRESGEISSPQGFQL